MGSIADQKKIAELQKQLSAIKDASPNLLLAFADKTLLSHFELLRIELWSEQKKKQNLDEARITHPKIPLKVPEGDVSFDFSVLGNRGILAQNEKIDAYYRDLSLHYNRFDEIASWYNKTARVDLFLHNTGGAPGEDIDVAVHFPDGMEVLEEDELPEFPDPPKPPRQVPDPPWNVFASPTLMPNLTLNKLITPPVLKNTQLLGIKKTRSYEVEFHIQRLKHHNHEPLPPIYLHFPSEPMSFGADFRIVAANVPVPARGRLNFIYEPQRYKR